MHRSNRETHLESDRPMHEIEIQVLQLQSVKRFLQAFLYIVRMMSSIPQLKYNTSSRDLTRYGNAITNS